MSAMHTPTASRPGRHLHEAEALLAVLLIIVLAVVVIAQRDAPATTTNPAQNALVAPNVAASQQRQEDLKDAWLAKRGVTSSGATAMRPGEDTLSAEWLAQRVSTAVAQQQRQETLKDSWLANRGSASAIVPVMRPVEDPHDVQKEKLMIQRGLISVMSTDGRQRQEELKDQWLEHRR